MFKITPIQSKEEAISVAKEVGAEYREGFFAYAMRDSKTEKLMGFSQFDISGDCGYISDIRSVGTPFDYEAMFILGRTTMSFIDNCGIHTARAPLSAADASLMLGIGFKNVNGEYFSDMSGLFNGECHKK